MIDWSRVAWDRRELEGVSHILIEPRLLGDKIVIQTQWVDADGRVIRQDAHIHVLELPPLSGEAAELT